MKVGYFYTQPHRDLINITPDKLENPNPRARLCPAVNDVLKNTFIIRCPYDISLKFKMYNEDGQAVIDLVESKSTLNNQEFNSFVRIHQKDEWTDPKIPLIQFAPEIVFVTDEKGLILEGFPAFLEYRPELPVRSTAFKFNCYNWLRSIQFGMDWMDTTKDIEFKRGDPLMYVRFNTEKDVTLQKMERTPELTEIVYRNRHLKGFIKGFSRHAMMIAGRTRPKRLLK